MYLLVGLVFLRQYNTSGVLNSIIYKIIEENKIHNVWISWKSNYFCLLREQTKNRFRSITLTVLPHLCLERLEVDVENGVENIDSGLIPAPVCACHVIFFVFTFEFIFALDPVWISSLINISKWCMTLASNLYFQQQQLASEEREACSH